VPVTDEPDIQGWPGWSADGRAILYSTSNDRRYQLLRINPADRSTKIMFESQRRPIHMPHVTTDERDLIYVRPEPSNVWKLPLKGGEPKQLTFDREGASFPAPSWDGQWIVYEVKRGEAVQIGVMDRNGGHQEILTEVAA